MELTPEEKQAIINVFTQIQLNRQESIMRESIIAKLQAKLDKTPGGNKTS